MVCLAYYALFLYEQRVLLAGWVWNSWLYLYSMYVMYDD